MLLAVEYALGRITSVHFHILEQLQAVADPALDALAVRGYAFARGAAALLAAGARGAAATAE